MIDLIFSYFNNDIIEKVVCFSGLQRILYIVFPQIWEIFTKYVLQFFISAPFSPFLLELHLHGGSIFQFLRFCSFYFFESFPLSVG